MAANAARPERHTLNFGVKTRERQKTGATLMMTLWLSIITAERKPGEKTRGGLRSHLQLKALGAIRPCCACTCCPFQAIDAAARTSGRELPARK